MSEHSSRRSPSIKKKENTKSLFREQSLTLFKRKIKARESLSGLKRVKLPVLKITRNSVLTHTRSELNMATLVKRSPKTNPKQYIPEMSRN